MEWERATEESVGSARPEAISKEERREEVPSRAVGGELGCACILGTVNRELELHWVRSRTVRTNTTGRTPRSAAHSAFENFDFSAAGAGVSCADAERGEVPDVRPRSLCAIQMLSSTNRWSLSALSTSVAHSSSITTAVAQYLSRGAPPLRTRDVSPLRPASNEVGRWQVDRRRRCSSAI